MSFDENFTDFEIPMPWGKIVGRTYGISSATPVLCVHGRSDNLETFRHLLPLLPKNFYYVCIDLPCHGKSSHPSMGFVLDLAWYALCVKRVIDHFKWPKLYYIGHSLGGQIGFLLAAMYPELIMKLVIIDTLMSYHIPPLKTAKALRDYYFDPTFKLEKRNNLDTAPIYSLQQFVEKMKQTRMTEVSEEEIRPMALRSLVQVGPDQYKYSNDQRTKILGTILYTLAQLEGIAQEISCPTLLILGNKSLTTRPLHLLSRSPLAKNSNVIKKIIEGDHDVHIAHAKETSGLISSFLSKDVVSKL